MKHYWQEIQNKSIEELEKELLDLRAQQMKLRMQLATQQLEQTHQVKVVRRNIARVKTLITQKSKV